MSHRTALYLHVWAVDDQERPAVIDAIAAADLAAYGTESDELLLGALYETEETPLGSSHELTQALLTTVPSAVFELWQDPHDSSEGHYVAHVPGTGIFQAPCDLYGRPYVSIEDITTSLLAHSNSTVKGWLSTTSEGPLGVRVLTALKEYQPRA